MLGQYHLCRSFVSYSSQKFLQARWPQWSIHHSPKLSSTSKSALGSLSSRFKPHIMHGFGAVRAPLIVCTATASIKSGTRRGGSFGKALLTAATALRSRPTCSFHTDTTSAASRSSLLDCDLSIPDSFMPPLPPAAEIAIPCDRNLSRCQRSLRPAITRAATVARAK